MILHSIFSDLASTEDVRRQRVLHHVFGAQRGGVEGNARALISGSPQIDHIVVVFGDDGPMVEDWRRGGATVEILGSASARPFVISTFLRKAIERYRPDGVIAWFGLVQLPQIIRVCNKQKVKLVVHAGNPAHTMPRIVDLRYLAMSCVWRAAGPLPVYACCSEYVSRSFESSYYLRQFPRTVIYNGIELPKVPTHQPRAYDPAVPFVIGMTARLSTIKDHATLLRAFAVVSREFPTVELELAGDGALRLLLESLARELSISEKVRFLGDVADIYAVMSGWSLFAYATTEREGLGNAVSEAMALGLPCVVTEVGPTKEFAGNDASVLLVRPADPTVLSQRIGELIADLPLRLRLSQAGRHSALTKFSCDKFGTCYMDSLS